MEGESLDAAGFAAAFEDVLGSLFTGLVLALGVADDPEFARLSVR